MNISSLFADLTLRFRTWQRGSLAANTALKVLIAGVGLALAFSLLGWAMVQQRESKRLTENISGLLATVEPTVRIACFTADQTLAAELANGLLSNPAVAAVRITSGSQVLAEVVKNMNAPPVMQTESSFNRKVTSPFNDADYVGEIVLFSDDAHIREQANGYSRLIIALSLIEMLIVSLVVAGVVLRTVVHPIRSFADMLGKIDINSGNHVSPPKENEFNEVGHLAHTFNNLLDRLLALLMDEQELRVRLAHKESRFRMLAENSPNLIVRYDLDCRRIYCNPAYEEKFGIASGMALNTTPEQLWQVANYSATEYQSILRKVMTSGLSEKVLLEWNRADGSLVINDFHLVPEWNADGIISNVVAIGHDISVLKQQQRLDKDRSLVFERIVQGGDLSDVLAMVTAHVERAIANQQCAILLLDEKNKCLRIGAASSLPDSYLQAADQFAKNFSDNGYSHFYWTGFIELAAQHNLIVSRYEPILNSENRLLGMLTLYQKPPASRAALDINFIRQACNLAAISIERKRIEALVQHHASYDALTNLPNRRLFGDRLRDEITKAQRGNSNVTLLFLDLDRFKAVNDTMGHEFGDMLLVETASRIHACVRESDTVARLGGDEFVVLIPDVADISHLGRTAKNIVDALSQPFELEGHIAYVSASIGVASYPSDADNADKLVSCADQAMYAAKDAGRNGFHFYSEELSIRANERLALELDLRHAIHRNELELYYQPKVGLADGCLIGSEALLRWKHPQRGMVPPDKFISIAEDSGLILEIGEWVLRDGCKTAREWNGDGKPLHKVAINLSARQFQSGNLCATVSAILTETRCAPEWIELEITESLLLEEGGDALKTLNCFQNMGITIAIDDFGTGYSALSYLARFPINTLKIDRSFINNVTDQGYHAELVKAIISIAHSLNQKVVAEGVETEAQAAALLSFGCHIAQGYLYSKPVPKMIFAALPHSFALEAASR
jgi:diguanylate cyclase (GGDEF)-like protein/PAS domain S-box-containing protein